MGLVPHPALITRLCILGMCMDAKIKRRDQNMKEALRLRDEEWKS